MSSVVLVLFSLLLRDLLVVPFVPVLLLCRGVASFCACPLCACARARAGVFTVPGIWCSIVAVACVSADPSALACAVALALCCCVGCC